MEQAEAKRREKDMGWNVVEDAGRGWRRVVASPLPKEIVEIEAIRALIAAGIIVISTGGGGIPVVRNAAGDLEGVAAVIDKDFGSSLLATNVGAELFVISTAVEKVALNFGKPDQKWLDKMTLAEAKSYLAEGKHFAKGSMAPKIQAIIRFLESRRQAGDHHESREHWPGAEGRDGNVGGQLAPLKRRSKQECSSVGPGRMRAAMAGEAEAVSARDRALRLAHPVLGLLVVAFWHTASCCRRWASTGTNCRCHGSGMSWVPRR